MHLNFTISANAVCGGFHFLLISADEGLLTIKNEQESINSIKLKIVFTYGNDGNPYYEGSHNIVYNQDMVLFYSEDSLTSVKQNMESGKTDTVIMRNDNIFIHKEKNDYGFL